jgi:hypothetical protein
VEERPDVRRFLKTYPSPEDPWPIKTKNEKRTKLFQIAPAENARFDYEYDLGDSWNRDILVEKILHPGERLKHSVCIKGRRAGPLEDCGGVPGYYEFLEPINDSAYPEHEDMLVRAGGEFDPETLDIEEVNRLLMNL